MSKFKGALASTILLGLLGGCGFTTTGDALRAAGLDKGAQAYDRLLENSEAGMCRIGSVRAVIERYFNTPERAEAWKTLCFPTPDLPDLSTKPAPKPIIQPPVNTE